MVVHFAGIGRLEATAAQELRRVRHGNQQECAKEREQGHGRQGGGERPVGNLRQGSNDHVLRIAGDRRHAAGVGRHGDGQQVGHRVSFQPHHEIEHQRSHDDANGVVDEERRKHAGDRDHRAEKDERMARPGDRPRRYKAEEARQAEVGDDDHHPEEERDRRHIDGRERLAEIEHVEGDHQAAAKERRAGAVQPIARQAADRHDHVGGGEDDDGGNQGW